MGSEQNNMHFFSLIPTAACVMVERGPLPFVGSQTHSTVRYLKSGQGYIYATMTRHAKFDAVRCCIVSKNLQSIAQGSTAETRGGNDARQTTSRQIPEMITHHDVVTGVNLS